MNSLRNRFILSHFLFAAGLCWIGPGSFQLSRALDQSVTGDLDVSGEIDVHGNSFSLGSWADTPSNYGLIWTYAEDATSHAATFTLTSSRAMSSWLWQKHVTGTGTGHVAQMALNDGNALILYNLAASQDAGIVLDPVNTSTFNTSVVMSGGNNRMPSQQIVDSTSVLTVGLADSRYYVANNGASVSLGQGANASGTWASALGNSANASGTSSTAVGFGASATGSGSTALGMDASATNTYATALSHASVASGDFAAALGVASVADGSHSVAIGSYSHAQGLYASAFGQGSLASGTAAVSLGDESQATNFGTSAFGYASHATGYGSTALSYISSASGSFSNSLGTYSLSNGDYAVSLGANSGAAGWGAEALGFFAAAGGTSSLALGSYSSASGSCATALGNSSVASGDFSVAAGRTSATSLYQCTVGAYGVSTGGDAHNWVATDDLFTVGNGQTPATASNALSIKKNGDMSVSGVLQVKRGVLVPQQGDLSMGEFTTGTPPQ